jgi:phage-related protein
MTTVAMPVTEKLVRESTLQTSFRTIASKFGDGYEQVAPDGINNIIDTWDLVWATLTTTEYQTVMTALKSVGTWGTITWIPCNETISKKFRLASGISTAREGSLYKITATVRQVFDL